MAPHGARRHQRLREPRDGLCCGPAREGKPSALGHQWGRPAAGTLTTDGPEGLPG